MKDIARRMRVERYVAAFLKIFYNLDTERFYHFISYGSGAFEIWIFLSLFSWSVNISLFLTGQQRRKCLIIFAKSIELCFEIRSLELLYLNVTIAMALFYYFC